MRHYQIRLKSEPRDRTGELTHEKDKLDQEWIKKEKMVAFAGHPLLLEDKVLGVIGLFSRKKLSDTLLKSLESVSDEISLGVQRKLSETSLIESEARFRELIEDTVDWIWEVNQDGVYTYCSPRVTDLLGCQPDEVVDKTPYLQ